LKQKQHINGQHPAEQACKIWRKNFQALLSNHILGVGSFFKPHPVELFAAFATDTTKFCYAVTRKKCKDST